MPDLEKIMESQMLDLHRETMRAPDGDLVQTGTSADCHRLNRLEVSPRI